MQAAHVPPPDGIQPRVPHRLIQGCFRVHRQNWAFSVLPVSAKVEPVPPVMTSATLSK